MAIRLKFYANSECTDEAFEAELRRRVKEFIGA